MWRFCQGRPVFACLPRVHSTAIHSQRIPLPVPSPTIHTCLDPCPCLCLVAVRHVSLSFACLAPIRCTFLRALNARRPKDRVRDNRLLSLVQPPLFAATLWPPPRPAQPSTTSTQISHTQSDHPEPFVERASAAHSIESLNRSKGPAPLPTSRGEPFSSGWGERVFCRQEAFLLPLYPFRAFVSATLFFLCRACSFSIAIIQSATVALRARAQSRA